MKEQQTSSDKYWISFRVQPEEYNRIHQLFEKSLCRKLSDYARKVLLNKPVITKYRNQSADELLSVLTLMKKELNAAGNNFNQAVKKLHTLKETEEVIRWFVTLETERRTFLFKVEEIKKTILKIYEKWSQE